MKILFTGGSSFTGSHFIRELAACGHNVTAIFRSRADEYADALRGRRVALVADACRPVHGCSFGDERFLSLIAEERWDFSPPRRRRHELQKSRLRRSLSAREQHSKPRSRARDP